MNELKEAVFHPSVRKTLRSLPKEIRKELGEAVYKLQLGLRFKSPLSKPIHAVAPGVEELRLKDSSGAYRVFYLSRFESKVIVFHAFRKKTQKTPKKEIETGKNRLKEILR